MNSGSRFQPLISVIRGHDRRRGLARFRNDYKAASGPLKGSVADSVFPLLERIQLMIEVWGSDDPPPVSAALDAWLGLYRESQWVLPQDLILEVLQRIPRPQSPARHLKDIGGLSASEVETVRSLLASERISAAVLKKATGLPSALKMKLKEAVKKAPVDQVDVGRILKESLDVVALRAIMDRGLLTQKSLKEFSLKNPKGFYGSSALDLLLAGGGVVPREVWDELVAGHQRNARLLGGPEALAQSFANDRGKDAPKWIYSFLVKAPEVRTSIAAALLVSRGTAPRVSWHIIAELQTKGTERRALDAIAVIKAIGTAAGETLSRTGRLGRDGVHALALCRMALTAPSASAGSSASVWQAAASVRADLATLHSDLVSRLLAMAEADGGQSIEMEAALVALTAEELYFGAHKFLQHLPVGQGNDAEPLERSLVVERFAARKDLLVDLIAALDHGGDPRRLEQAIEAALFNAGVRPLGVVGNRVRFDTQLHEATSSAPFPGDLVVLVQEGRIVGSEVDGLILRRAKVSLPGDAEGRELP